MDTITYYDRVVPERLELLKQNVCKNWPVKDDNPDRLKMYQRSLLRYTCDKDGLVKIEYHNTKKFNSRLYGIGPCAQKFQKHIRKFLSGGSCSDETCSLDECKCPCLSSRVVDIDMVNCHPALLYSYLRYHTTIEKNNYRLLKKYIKDRSATMAEYPEILTKKTSFMEIMNNQNLDSKASRFSSFVDFHKCVYGDPNNPKMKSLFTEFSCQEKTTFREMYRDANDASTNGDNRGNLMGKLLSRILQNFETTLLNDIAKKLSRRGFIVRSLVFDGCMVDRDENLTQQVLDTVCAEIARERQFHIQLIFKSMNTKWTPDMSIEPFFETQEQMPDILDISEARKRFESDGFKDTIVNGKLVRVPDFEDDNPYLSYISKFVQQVKMTQNYLVRENSNDKFKIMDKSTTKSFLKHPEKDGNIKFKLMEPIMLNPYMPQYDGIDFYINIDTNDTLPNKKIYNLFQRPKYTLDYPDTLDSFPLLKEYFETVLCAGETPDTIYILLSILSNSFKYGKTDMCIVLYGLRGAGKSFLVEGLLSQVFNDQYWRTVIGFDDLKEMFNSLQEGNIWTLIDEVNAVGHEYMNVQEKLKGLITDKKVRIRKMRTDPYEISNTSNYVISTNHNCPVKIYEDTRRYFPLKVSDAHLQDEQFFKDLYQEISDNIERIRGFLLKYDCPRRFTIPHTNAFYEMLESGKSSIQLWIDEKFEQYWNDTANDSIQQISIELVHNEYKKYHKMTESSGRILSQKLFIQEFNKYSKTHKIVRRKQNGINLPWTCEQI